MYIYKDAHKKAKRESEEQSYNSVLYVRFLSIAKSITENFNFT